MKRIYSLLLCLFSLMLFSCEKEIEQPARNLLSLVQNEFNSGNYSKAKSLIDSIKDTCPKAYKTLREAESLRHEILIKEKERDIAFFEQELKALMLSRDSLLPEFEYRKNSQYQDIGIYSVPSQDIAKNAFNNYLRATVKENGEAVITSFYRGKRIGYKVVKASCGDVYVTAENSIYSWTGKEYGVYVERRDYKRGDDGGLMDFIAASEGKVLVALLSEESIFEYELRAEDIKAISKVKALADVLASITECNEMLNAAQYSLDFLMKGSERLKKETGKRKTEN